MMNIVAMGLMSFSIVVTMAVTVMLSLFLLCFRKRWLGFFVKDGHHYSWCATSLLYLEEGMIVIKFFFAVRTVVKVFTNSALVTNSDDW